MFHRESDSVTLLWAVPMTVHMWWFLQYDFPRLVPSGGFQFQV